MPSSAPAVAHAGPETLFNFLDAALVPASSNPVDPSASNRNFSLPTARRPMLDKDSVKRLGVTA